MPVSPDLIAHTLEEESLTSPGLAYIAVVQEVLREHAREAAEARRGAELGDLPTEPGRPGVFAWLHNGPSSGQRAVLAYNKAASPLRCSAPAKSPLVLCNW